MRRQPIFKRVPAKNESAAVPETDASVEPSVFPFLVSPHRRLLTQLEAAKGSRGGGGGGGAAGDGKAASAKGPDGVVLYELHSRPEQEKFTESAKVHRLIVSGDLVLGLFSSFFL